MTANLTSFIINLLAFRGLPHVRHTAGPLCWNGPGHPVLTAPNHRKPRVDMETLRSSFLGSIAEVCIVSGDHKKTMNGLLQLGIGPFQVFDFTPTTVPERYFRGQAGTFELKVCFAKHAGLTFEIMQPMGGESLMAEYLDQRRGKEGVQHIAFDCQDIPMVERKREMRKRGFETAMEGIWKGKKGTCNFCFFDTEASTGTIFESIEFSEDWEDPDFEWYPHPPRKDALYDAEKCMTKQ